MRLKVGGKYTGGGWMQKKRLACSKLRAVRPLFVGFNTGAILAGADTLVDTKLHILCFEENEWKV